MKARRVTNCSGFLVWPETGATKRPSEPRLSGVHPEEAQWNQGAKPPRLRLEGELSECLERNVGLERDFMCCIVNVSDVL